MPGRLDQTRPFLPVNIAILTISDTRDAAQDRSGNTLAELTTSAGHHVVAQRIVRDDQDAIVAQLRAWIADPKVDVVISTGGTGVTGRDVTPEAFHSIYEKEIAGFGELFRWLSYDKIGTSTIQSRATAGVAGGTYLFALPGSPSACRDAWEGILVHQLDNRFRPCNFVELMPRTPGASEVAACQADTMTPSRSVRGAVGRETRPSHTAFEPDQVIPQGEATSLGRIFPGIIGGTLSCPASKTRSGSRPASVRYSDLSRRGLTLCPPTCASGGKLCGHYRLRLE